MAIHKIDFEDFEDCDLYALIAIHCSLEDYRLAYLLNNKLNLKLERKSNDLDFSEAKYSIFEWEDKNQLTIWNLVSNICKVEINQNQESESLFYNQNKIVSKYNLLPEHKTVNYLLKINYQMGIFNKETILNKLLSIPQIVTAYSLDVKNLRAKTNLIFN